MDLQVTPYNEQAEQSVIGCIILDKECIGTAMQIVRSDDFYDPRNKEMYECVMALYDVDKPIDIITMSEQLKLRGTYDKVGGEMYLVEIANAVSTSANIRHYAKIIADYGEERLGKGNV